MSEKRSPPLSLVNMTTVLPDSFFHRGLLECCLPHHPGFSSCLHKLRGAATFPIQSIMIRAIAGRLPWPVRRIEHDVQEKWFSMRTVYDLNGLFHYQVGHITLHGYRFIILIKIGSAFLRRTVRHIIHTTSIEPEK